MNPTKLALLVLLAAPPALARDGDLGALACVPGASEVCNHADDNCTGGVDEGFPHAVTGELHPDPFPGLNDYFGWAMAAVGDIDGDGVSDLAVGAVNEDHMGWDVGMVVLYSGADRRALWYSPSTEQLGYLGRSLAGSADLDGDGVRDILAGCPGWNAVRLLSGADGHEFARCVDPGGGGVGQYHVASLGDLDGDGVPEIAAGSPTNNERVHHQGKVPVFRYDRGTGGCTLLLQLWDTVAEGAYYDNLGTSVAGVGDLTGDGIPDIGAGQPGDDPGTGDEGSVLIFSGADGSLARRITDPARVYRDNLGIDLHGIEDLNGDGVPDLAVATERRNSWEGEVILFSGADGTVLRRLTDASTLSVERVGGAIDVVSDVDGDGLDDILAGARYATVDGVSQCGRALVLSSGTGAILGVLPPPVKESGALFGYAVAEVGDSTGDGIPEFAVGAPYQGVNETGSFAVLSLESVCDDDGVSPFGGDCDDADPAVWGRSSEVRGLRFSSRTVLTWTEPENTGGTLPIRYDTLRSTSAAVFGEEACFVSGGSETSTADADSPALGTSFFYLVRAENACGDGDLGSWGGLGWPREAATCP
ncbi:MAG TPA: FG-GAP-like repeat-containing protein [Candidatus Polarisedimenticolaceae bacterium]|nr:FG-GAP-like repeat-containing protein [Candidatus Polarisedimenticolaceae bacterium]